MKYICMNIIKMILIVSMLCMLRIDMGFKMWFESIEFDHSYYFDINNYLEQVLFYPKVKAYQCETYNYLHTEQVISNHKKKIYIYNTHQDEKYLDGYSVMDGANYLKECLSKYDYEVIVENSDLKKYRDQNGYTYNDSYVVSKFFIEEAIKKYSKFDLIIDFHRDSIARDLCVSTIDEQNYAKMMFVVAGSSKFHDQVEKLCNQYYHWINEQKMGIMRNVYVRKEAYYNQFIQENMILVECGSDQNYFEEVKNSLQYLAMAIHEGWSKE